MMHRWMSGAFAAVLCSLTIPATAEPATSNVLQFGAGFRYGLELEEGDFNPWGPGLGLQVGYTLPAAAIYVGGNFDYFFGDTLDVGGVELSGNIWQLMAEAGYDVGLGEVVVLRPKIGVGFASLNAETCIDPGGCTDDSSTDFALAPGATFILLTEKFSLSLDVRYDMIFADETLNALIFSAGVGF
jgi:opacity protein-like surface antigen